MRVMLNLIVQFLLSAFRSSQTLVHENVALGHLAMMSSPLPWGPVISTLWTQS